MRNDHQLPSRFGPNWEYFVREWCLNCTLGYSQFEVQRALSTLERVWPEKVQEITSGSTRGASIVVGPIELGKLIADCEHLCGFDPVLARLKLGERSAYSELVLVSSLIALGYAPSFEALLNGKHLDAVCPIEGPEVYFEVVTPDLSDLSLDLQKLGDNLSHRIKQVISQCRVEVAILERLNSARIESIVQAVRVATPLVWLSVASYARIRKVPVGHALPPTFDGEGSKVVIVGDTETQSKASGVIVRWEDDDERAKRIFNAEYHHFSANVPNILVVDACAVGGLSNWPRLMKRVLQPTQNRKVGAVALFEQGILGPPEAIRRRWCVIANPHVRAAIPASLIKGLRSLDESHHFGMPSPDDL